MISTVRFIYHNLQLGSPCFIFRVKQNLLDPYKVSPFHLQEALSITQITTAWDFIWVLDLSVLSLTPLHQRVQLPAVELLRNLPRLCKALPSR